MDITLAADGWCIAKPPGDSAIVVDNSRFTSALIACGSFTQRLQGFDCCKPGTKVLGGKRPPTGVPQVVIDVGRVDPVPLALAVDPLKEFLARKSAQRRTNPGQPGSLTRTQWAMPLLPRPTSMTTCGTPVGAVYRQGLSYWFATVEALQALRKRPATQSKRVKRELSTTIAAVARRLAIHQPSAASVISIGVLTAYADGRLARLNGAQPAVALRGLLRRQSLAASLKASLKLVRARPPHNQTGRKSPTAR